MAYLNSGPILIPANPVINQLLISLRNPGITPKLVTVLVNKSATGNTSNTLPAPTTAPSLEVNLLTQSVTLAGQTSEIIVLPAAGNFAANDILEVTVLSAYKKERQYVQVSVVGRLATGNNEESTLVRYEEFVKLGKDKHDDEDDDD